MCRSSSSNSTVCVHGVYVCVHGVCVCMCMCVCMVCVCVCAWCVCVCVCVCAWCVCMVCVCVCVHGVCVCVHGVCVFCASSSPLAPACRGELSRRCSGGRPGNGHSRLVPYTASTGIGEERGGKERRGEERRGEGSTPMLNVLVQAQHTHHYTSIYTSIYMF